jgi:predicted NBD/HSP70 family sugar kinase
MERLEARGRAIAEAAAERAADRVAARLGEVPGVVVAVEPGRIVVSGRGLWRRPELRWIGGIVR